MTSMDHSRLTTSPFGMPTYGSSPPSPVGSPFTTSPNLTVSGRPGFSSSVPAAPTSEATSQPQTMLNSGNFASRVVSMPSAWQSSSGMPVGGTPAYSMAPLSYTPPSTIPQTVVTTQPLLPQMASRVEPVSSSLAAHSLRTIVPSMGGIEASSSLSAHSRRNPFSSMGPIGPSMGPTTMRPVEVTGSSMNMMNTMNTMMNNTVPGAPMASMGSVVMLDRSRISSMGPGIQEPIFPGVASGYDNRSMNASAFQPPTVHSQMTGVISPGSFSAPRSPSTPNPFAMSQVGHSSAFPTMVPPQDKFYREDPAPLEFWDQVSESSDDFPPPAPEEDEEDTELFIHRLPLQSATGTNFAGEISDTAFDHFHDAPEAHATHEVEHRLRAAQEAHHHAQRELDEAMHHHYVHHQYAQAHDMDPLLHRRLAETDPDRVYKYTHPGHAVLKHGAGIQETDPYPFWVGAGTPAARLEPTWIGGEWYLVAPVDFKGLENAHNTHGFDKEMQNHQLRVVDDAVHHLESQGQLPAFPPPRHWKEHKNCPIA